MLDPIWFFSTETLSTIKNETTIESELRQQLAPGRENEVLEMESNAETIKSSTSVLVGGSFAVNLILSGSLSLLWGLINSLQLVTHFPLTNVIFPINAKTYYSVMFEIGNLDMIPTEDLEQVIDESVGDADLSEKVFDASSNLSDSTIDAGYDSTNILLGCTLNLLIFAMVLLISLLVIILRLVCSRFNWVKQCLQKIWRTMFWNFVIRSTLEKYLEMSLLLMIKMYAINLENWFEVTGSMFSIVVLTLMTLFNLLVPIFLHCKRSAFKEPEFISKYGSLVADLRVNELAARLYYMMFMLRRQIFTLLIVYVAKRPWA